MKCYHDVCQNVVSDSTEAAHGVIILNWENDGLFLLLKHIFNTHNLSRLFTPRKVPLLSSEILLFSRCLREKKNISFEKISTRPCTV